MLNIVFVIYLKYITQTTFLVDCSKLNQIKSITLNEKFQKMSGKKYSTKKNRKLLQPKVVYRYCIKLLGMQ